MKRRTGQIVHTLELVYPAGNNKQIEIINNLGVHKIAEHKYETTKYTDEGLKIQYYTNENSNKDICICLYYIINPLSILGEFHPVSTFSAADAEWKYAEQSIDAILKNIGLPLVSQTYLYRLDLAIDACTPYPAQYAILARKCNLGKCYVRSHGIEEIYYSGSFHAHLKSGDTCINFYAKEMERMNKNASNDEIAQAKGIFRLELQIGRKKLDASKSKYAFSMRTAQEFFSNPKKLYDMIKKEIIENIIQRCCGEGKYYPLPIAIEMVKNSKKRTKTKNNCIQILTIVNQYAISVDMAKDILPLSKSQFESAIKVLNGLNINPVTIPNSDLFDVISAEEKENGLPSLYELAMTAYETERDAMKTKNERDRR